MMEGTHLQLTVGERSERVRRLASDRFRREPDWVSFYREVIGVNGIIDRMFPSFDDRCKFEQTEAFVEIQRMLAKLRDRTRIQRKTDEATKVITVRLPESLHDALRNEAHNHRTSMNKLCISKLLQVIDDEFVPSDVDRPEGNGKPSTSTETPAASFTQPVPQPEPQPVVSQQPPATQPSHFLGGSRPF